MESSRWDEAVSLIPGRVAYVIRMGATMRRFLDYIAVFLCSWADPSMIAVEGQGHADVVPHRCLTYPDDGSVYGEFFIARPACVEHVYFLFWI